MDFVSLLQKKILLLDGGMGTMIQKYHFTESDFRGREFMSHPQPISGYNDILNLTNPSSIKKIHLEYLRAGSDIITTNTFNSNSISLSDYGLEKIEGLISRLNRTGASIAREAIEESGLKDRFIAGSIGPTNRSASLSPDISRPSFRNIGYEDLFYSYKEQIRGLIEGKVDILLFETFFDTLNLKAGLDAANTVINEIGVKLPIMISATISDKIGHLLSGQNLAAFITSVADYQNVVSIGINCGFGPDEVKGFLKEIAVHSPHYISCHPNAGLPDELGCYNVTPEDFKVKIKSILEQGFINIIGGCCGTTPEHILEISHLVKIAHPYEPKPLPSVLRLSGTEAVIENATSPLIVVGERCNVAGSRKFLRLIKEGKIEEATEIAKEEIKAGAKIIDINMDDPMLDASAEMINFLRYIASEPEIAKVPVMIDSSKWDVIEYALMNIQGKGIVNSLSLKEGEKIFIEKARRIKDLGFALLVMAFDEKGQADTFERKIEICRRAYNILIKKCGFSSDDIIFDVNIMAIATGIPEHSKYALEFIKAVKWIKENLPGARTSGGISNLSFSFRGKNKIREMMHSVFLKNAIEAGLDMAIVNPSALLSYSQVPEEIRNIMEDVILTGNHESEKRLIDLVIEDEKIDKKQDEENTIINLDVNERLMRAMLHGELRNLKKDLDEALMQTGNPLKIIDGPLMDGMKKVGQLFGEGKMYLPQVVKTARVMNEAVEYLKPYITADAKHRNVSSAGKILIATVKGDVHDIGKNIVSTVLSCNNFEVIDLGVMVPSEKIIKKIREENPDILCLSGLITPSLTEMAKVVEELEKEGIKIPVMVGGAATSPLHTLLRIAPSYSGLVLHMSDASQNPVIAKRILHDDKDNLLSEIREKNEKLLKAYQNKNHNLLSFQEAILKGRQNKKSHNSVFPRIGIGKPFILHPELKEIVPFINWKMFFNSWKLQGSYLEHFPYNDNKEDFYLWKNEIEEENKDKAQEAIELFLTANSLLNFIEKENLFDGKASVRFEEASADDKNIYLANYCFPMLRQQEKESSCLSCTDFFSEKNSHQDYIGFFALTAGHIWNKQAIKFENEGNNYKALILQSLGDRVAEAFSEWLHLKVRKELWGYSAEESIDIPIILKGNYQGIRPAWGYPMLPDQTLILKTEGLLPYEDLGISLTENGAMNPSSSISGLYISNPYARYFMIGKIGEDQIKDYSERRNISFEKMKNLLR